MQGGPGCSSFDGLMMEVGPWRTDGKGGLKTADGGWEEYATVVYGAFHPLSRSRTLHLTTITPLFSRPAGGYWLLVCALK